MDSRPKDYSLESPKALYRASVKFGQARPGTRSSGFGRRCFPTTVTVVPVLKPSKTLMTWKENTEKATVTFSEDGRYLEMLWQIEGCIPNSTGVRHFRNVFHLPSGVELVSSSSDFRVNEDTTSRPNPVGSKPSATLDQMLRSRLRNSYKQWDRLPNRSELTEFLSVIADSGVDISRSDGIIRQLVSLLCRDLDTWSHDEVQLRLVIIKILSQAKAGTSREFIDRLIPRGRIREPAREEHNRLADEFTQKLTAADLPAHREDLKKIIAETLDGGGSADNAIKMVKLLYPRPDEAAAVCGRVVAAARRRVEALEQAFAASFSEPRPQKAQPQ